MVLELFKMFVDVHVFSLHYFVIISGEKPWPFINKFDSLFMDAKFGSTWPSCSREEDP